MVISLPSREHLKDSKSGQGLCIAWLESKITQPIFLLDNAIPLAEKRSTIICKIAFIYD